MTPEQELKHQQQLWIHSTTTMACHRNFDQLFIEFWSWDLELVWPLFLILQECRDISITMIVFTSSISILSLMCLTRRYSVKMAYGKKTVFSHDVFDTRTTHGFENTSPNVRIYFFKIIIILSEHWCGKRQRLIRIKKFAKKQKRSQLLMYG